MRVRFVDFGKQYLDHKKEIDSAMQSCLRDGQLVLRKDLEKLEKKFAKYIGVKYAVGLNSGTDALYLALKASGVGKGDVVLTWDHTFVATVQVIVQLGAVPVFFDSKIYDSDAKLIKAIIVPHITGEMKINMSSILKCAKENNWIVIEDACQALGATQDGKKAGSFGIGCFSFYPAKILGCFGDGGMLTTNDKKIADEVRELRNHYKKDYSRWGINSRLDNLQAVVLNIKMKYLNKALKRRKQIARMYLKGLDGVVGLPIDREGRVWQDFVINAGKERDALYKYLKRNGIETMKNEYPFPIEKSILSSQYEKETLRLPCNETLTDAQINFIIKTIIRYEGKGKIQ